MSFAPRFEPDDPALLDPLQYAVAARDQDVLAMVRHALTHQQAKLAFHPIVTTGAHARVAFHEGLIRVLDQAGRVIPAAQFMPLIEETDLGREVDCIALFLAFRMLRQNPQLRLSINLSARSLADGKWRETLYQGLHEPDHLGDRLIFEISESSAMILPEVVIRFMEDMQTAGVAFALDGFGAGLIAFRHLKDFYFDLVKIDKSFIRNIDVDPENRALTKALMTVAHQFEMLVVADGVETRNEAKILEDMEADCLQGYYFGVPKFSLS